MPPQLQVGLHAKLLELLEVTAGGPTHGVYHRLCEPERRRCDQLFLRIVAQDVAEVNVQKVTVVEHHDVVEMAVTDAEDEGDDCVARGRLCERHHHRVLHAEPHVVRVGVFLLEVLQERAAVLGQDHADGHRGRSVVGRDELEQPTGRTSRKHTVRPELEVKPNLFEYFVHDEKELNHELVLPHVIAVFEHDLVRQVVGLLRRQLVLLHLHYLARLLATKQLEHLRVLQALHLLPLLLDLRRHRLVRLPLEADERGV
mmetsp:Transcript_56608/g.156678  ORF Transcript_56608/g.156678 Transcript_56608/m.156678 type:complete len:257 (-) Transcript_56608:532-1302(-)